MWNVLITLIERIAVALAPAVLGWIGNEALSLIEAHVRAENAKRESRAAAGEAKAEAAAPSSRDELVDTLKQGTF